MSDLPSEAPRFLRPKSLETSSEVDAITNAASVAALMWREEKQGVELPARLFEQLPFAVYVCDANGLVLRYNSRAATLWGRSPRLGDPNERFCGSYRMFRPDGSLLPHHECPMAEVLRTGISCANRKCILSGRTACVASRSLTSRHSGIAMETLSAPSIASKI